jgi:replicative DNA helicase
MAYDRRIIENGPDGGNVRYGDILKGRGTAWQRDRAKQAAKMLASLPISVNDQGGLTIEDIRSQALRQVRAWEKGGIQPGAILIDHIGLVKAHNRRASDSKAAETADIVNELKGLAKQVRAPVIALVQVNRNTEGRSDKRPTLADLNWSGAIEQIADFICLLYRDSYYLERSSDDEDRTEAIRKRYDLELLIAKNRSGPICTLNAFADVSCNAIRDIEPTQERRFG